MSAKRKAEIVGAGFAGLAAACALARRGWQVRVHERSDRLRAAGAGIYIYENGLRVLEVLGAYDEAVATAPIAHTREIRDEKNRVLSVHRWDSLQACVQRGAPAGHPRARGRGAARRRRDRHRLGRRAGDPGRAAKAGERRGDRCRSHRRRGRRQFRSLRDSVALLEKRRKLPDGAIRLLLEATPQEQQSDSGTTVEYWSGSRRVLYTPCSGNTIYIAMTMLDRDAVAKAVPIEAQAWFEWFPHLRDLIVRIGSEGRYDRFEYIKLKHWSAGRVAVLGDAAHALATEHRARRRLRHDERVGARCLSRPA